MKECSLGQMDVNTKETTSTIRKKAMVSSTGPTAESTTDTGEVESKKELAYTLMPKERSDTADGTTESGQSG